MGKRGKINGLAVFLFFLSVFFRATAGKRPKIPCRAGVYPRGTIVKIRLPKGERCASPPMVACDVFPTTDAECCASRVEHLTLLGGNIKSQTFEKRGKIPSPALALSNKLLNAPRISQQKTQSFMLCKSVRGRAPSTYT